MTIKNKVRAIKALRESRPRVHVMVGDRMVFVSEPTVTLADDKALVEAIMRLGARMWHEDKDQFIGWTGDPFKG